MSEALSSDEMKNLVIVLIKLSILGLILAFVAYYSAGLPIQNAAIHAPTNAAFS